MLLEGKNILITGASRGIGRGTAQASDLARYVTGAAVLVDGAAFVNLP